MKMRCNKANISAWILLSVLVPMLLLSAFHIHTPVEHVVDCEQCVEHVHHAGHITQASASVDDCLLCRVLHTPFTTPKPLIVFVLCILLSAFCMTASCRIDRNADCVSLRGPPIS